MIDTDCTAIILVFIEPHWLSIDVFCGSIGETKLELHLIVEIALRKVIIYILSSTVLLIFMQLKGIVKFSVPPVSTALAHIFQESTTYASFDIASRVKLSGAAFCE